MLKNSCYWSNDKMNEYQLGKIKKLLIESYDGIPYYKNLFDNLAFNPQTKFKTLSDLSILPILDKDFVKKNKELFINKKYVKNLHLIIL